MAKIGDGKPRLGDASLATGVAMANRRWTTETMEPTVVLAAVEMAELYSRRGAE